MNELKDKLPENAQISKSVFLSGFYYSGDLIKYRMSVWGCFRPWGFDVYMYFFMFLCFIMAAFLCSFQIYSLAIFIFLAGFAGTIDTLITEFLFPVCGFDMQNRIFVYGRVFKKKISFDKFISISTHFFTMYSGSIKVCTYVQLKTHQDEFSVARFHVGDEYQMRKYIEALKFLINEKLTVKINK